MPRFGPVKKIAHEIKKLRAERAACAKKLAEIDALFAALGLATGGATAAVAEVAPAAAPAGRPGRKGKRKRGKFAVSGDVSVLEFVKANAKCTAKEVNAHWQGEGRGGSANNTLTRLVQDGKLKRLQGAKGDRGGRYDVA